MATRADEKHHGKRANTNPPSGPGKVSLHVYIDKGLKRRVEQRAAKDKRQMPAEVEVILEAGLAAIAADEAGR